MCKLRLAFQDVLKSQCVHWNCSPLCLAFMWSLRWHLRFDSNSQCEHWKFLSILCTQKDWENGRLIDYLNTRKYFPYLNGRSVKKQMIWNKWWNIRNMHPCPTHGTRLCLHRADTVHNVKSMGAVVCLFVSPDEREVESRGRLLDLDLDRCSAWHRSQTEFMSPSAFEMQSYTCWILHRLEYSGMITFDTFNTQSILDFSRKFSKHCFLIIFSMSRKMRS